MSIATPARRPFNAACTGTCIAQGMTVSTAWLVAIAECKGQDAAYAQVYGAYNLGPIATAPTRLMVKLRVLCYRMQAHTCKRGPYSLSLK